MESPVAVNPDAGYALIVNYLPPSFNDHDLHDLFAHVGPLYSAKIMRNKVRALSMDLFRQLLWNLDLPYTVSFASSILTLPYLHHTANELFFRVWVR